MMVVMSRDVCEAMEGAGIDSPDGQAGIDFCLSSCPYSECRFITTKKSYTKQEAVSYAISLHKTGMGVKDIARKLGVSDSLVYKYLKERWTSG
jgi:DNA invertase Pin-like site-specific DNA recombinase|tara:strand:+ start:9250 stop:9528 length:279 start_codon:yes stop_codon:yes gene_type:complete